MKKSVKLIIIAAACVVVLGAAVGISFALFTFVGGELVPTTATELDFSGKGLTDVSGLERCSRLESLDIRGNDITAAQFDSLREALPECDILWSVPIGMERYDSNISEFSLAAEYVEDLYNVRYFTEITSCDVSGTQADDESLYELNMSIPDINIYWTTTIGGVEYLTNAEELDLSKAKIDYPEAVKYFTEVKKLTLPGGLLTDLAPLARLVKLEYLDITDNHVTDISALAGMTGLVELYLTETWSNDAIKDLTPLGALTNLEVLSLNHCSGENYEIVTQLPALRELDLTQFGDNMTDYSFLAELTTLETLSLTYSGLMTTDFQYLSGLDNLRTLDLTGVYVTDPSPLYGLDGLETLTISDTASAFFEKDLLAALPDCEIIWA